MAVMATKTVSSKLAIANTARRGLEKVSFTPKTITEGKRSQPAACPKWETRECRLRDPTVIACTVSMRPPCHAGNQVARPTASSIRNKIPINGAGGEKLGG